MHEGLFFQRLNIIEGPGFEILANLAFVFDNPGNTQMLHLKFLPLSVSGAVNLHMYIRRPPDSHHLAPFALHPSAVNPEDKKSTNCSERLKSERSKSM